MTHSSSDSSSLSTSTASTSSTTTSSLVDSGPSTASSERRREHMAAAFHLEEARGECTANTSTAEAFFRPEATNPGVYELTKLFIGLVTLVPLRVVLIVLLILPYYLVARLVVCFPPTHFGKSFLEHMTRGVSRTVLFLCGFHWLHVRGAPEEDSTRVPIIVSNHVSFVEVLFFMSMHHPPAFVFKQECLKLPVIGKIARDVLGSVPVDHAHRGTGATETIVKLVHRMQADETGVRPRQLLIFPEGTTTNGTCLIRFRTGAFVAGVPVQPVVVRLPFRHFSPTYESIYTWVFVLRMLSQFHNRLDAEFLPAYVPSDEERRDPHVYADNVRTAMALHADLGFCCEVSFKDKMAYHKILDRQFHTCHLPAFLAKLVYVHPTPSGRPSVEPNAR